MAISREDKADVKGAMGKAMANKVANVTRDNTKSRALKIKQTVKSFGSTMRPSKKAAPGITYSELTPKEKHYRGENERRTSNRLKAFHSSPYGKHLSARAARRGEKDL
jgi:hypothetical protein